MRHALVALGISSLSVACGGRVVLGDLPDDGGVEERGIDASRPDASSDSDDAGRDAADTVEAGPDGAGPEGAGPDGTAAGISGAAVIRLSGYTSEEKRTEVGSSRTFGQMRMPRASSLPAPM